MREVIQLIQDARDFAKLAHGTQARKYGGGLYWQHPLRVGFALAAMGAEAPLIVAGYLHDVVEDTPVTLGQISDLFGSRVAAIVAEVTEEPRKGVPRGKRKKESRDRLRKASLSARLLKAIDRCDNLEDMLRAPRDFQKLYAEESLKLADALDKGEPEIQGILKALRVRAEHLLSKATG